ncbi:YbaK/EbsC family protein [Photobacterium sp. SDRW27]|uniref:aminoacyl-tRNA deacylase n=1 Tax=Photobacterium obscurum TaxID=2829490 RepID=UPI002242C839|nr:YbaK/EbsC family protein [Photobacterium obscurum]MCW8331726.1 YbaK/EbsC family protein [Photobacterium obscurum]
MAIAKAVSEFLTKKNVSFGTVAHPKSSSSCETAHAAHIPEDHLAKSVLLKDEKGYLLAVVPASEWISLDRLNDELNRDLQLVPEEEMDQLFSDCQPGAIPPLGEAYGIETIVDDALHALSKVYFEAGDHKQLIQVNSEQFHTLMKGLRHGYYCKSN